MGLGRPSLDDQEVSSCQKSKHPLRFAANLNPEEYCIDFPFILDS
jgi:hypothetical protein